jgi:Antitoxin VbhA
MGEVKTKAKPRISAKEMARRKEAVRWADAHNRIEGLKRSPATDAIYDAFVRGDIEFDDILPRLKALHHRL